MKCIRCGQLIDDGECSRAPDRGPHEAPELPEVRLGFSLHEKECPRSDPNPLLDPECRCARSGV